MKFSSTEIKVFLTFFLIYSFFIYWSGDSENSRFFLTRSIADEGRFEIDTFYNQTSDRSFFNNHYYSDKTPGTSFLALPTYAVWKEVFNVFGNTKISDSSYLTRWVGENRVPVYDYVNPSQFTLTSMVLITIFTSSLFGALTVVLFYKILKFRIKDENTRLFSTYLFGLGTLIFPYSTAFLEFVPATFFVFLPLYLLTPNKVTNKTILVAGILLGFSLVTSFLVLPILIGYLIYYLKFKKKFILVLLGIVLGVSPLLIYNFIIFRNPLILPIFYLDKSIWIMKEPSHKIQLQNLILNALIGKNVSSQVAILLVLKSLFYPINGLFYYYPVFLFSFLGIYRFFQEKKIRPQMMLISISFFLMVFFIGTDIIQSMWTGAFFGPRVFVIITPFLSLPLAYLFENSKKTIKILITVLFIYSVLLNFASLQPKEDFLTSDFGTKTNFEYVERFKDPLDVIFNPITEYYLPLFFKYGPRSRIVENLINGQPVDIRFLLPEHRESFSSFYFHVPFLSLLIIILITSIIWRKEIRNKWISIKREWKIGVLALSTIVLLSMVILLLMSSIKDISFKKGWYPNSIKEKEIWMKQDGVIWFDETEEIAQTMKLTTLLGSYYRNRKVEIFLNDRLIDIVTAYSSQELEYSIILDPISGMNIIRFHATPDCDISNIAEKKNDTRCLSISLSEFDIENTEENYTFNKYWYAGKEKWVMNNGTIQIINPEDNNKEIKILSYLKSYYKDRDIHVYLNDQLIDSFVAFKEGSEIYTPMITLKPGENILKFHSDEGCKVISEIGESNDNRCISIGVKDVSLLSQNEIKESGLEYIFNKNWYDKSPNENERWMNNNSTISLFYFDSFDESVIINFDFFPYSKERTITFYLNEKLKNVFEIDKDGGWVYTAPLYLKSGENILRFYSDEGCTVIDDIEKNGDHRCVSISMRNIALS